MRLENHSSTEFRNRTIVKLRKEGKSQAEIAKLVDCSQALVSKILSRYRLLGESGLLVQGKAPGRTPRLSQKQLNQLAQFLEQGALAHGFETDNWTQLRIAELIRISFDVSYHPAHMSRIMRKINFSLQKPQKISYRKQDQEAQQWKSTTLPAIKKSKE